MGHLKIGARYMSSYFERFDCIHYSAMHPGKYKYIHLCIKMSFITRNFELVASTKCKRLLTLKTYAGENVDKSENPIGSFYGESVGNGTRIDY